MGKIDTLVRKAKTEGNIVILKSLVAKRKVDGH